MAWSLNDSFAVDGSSADLLTSIHYPEIRASSVVAPYLTPAFTILFFGEQGSAI